MQHISSFLTLSAFIASVAAVAAAVVECSIPQLIAHDRRFFRMTFGGTEDLEKATEQNISFDNPVGTQVTGIIDFYLRDVEGAIFRDELGMDVHGAEFANDKDSSFSFQYRLPLPLSMRQYTYWVDVQLKSGEICTTGGHYVEKRKTSS